jgi:glycosyltransferase involved in cell wall biosynthesis
VGIRIAVIDDNPHVSWESRIYPVNATFHRFLAAVLDVPGEPVASIVHCVPVRPASSAPATLPLDERLEVVATTAFDGIAGYLRHAPWIVARNARLLRPVIRAADLVWIKVPASNALLAATLARAAGIPRFGYVAGRAAEVAAAQDRGWPGGSGARLVGAAYDLAGRIASAGGDRLVVGANLEAGGVVTSLVEPQEVRDESKEAWPAHADVLRLAWAGRLVEGKGLEALLDAVAQIAVEPPESRLVQLVLLGDGPARPALEARARSLGVEQRVEWRGFIADRAIYLEALAACDLFVFPSPAEGFPKVVLDAMAVGLPVVARPSGSLEDLAAGGVIERMDRQAGQMGAEIRRLAANPARVAALRRAGSAFVAEHTRVAEAGRLVSRWRERWPNLPWDRPGPGIARIAGNRPAARTRGE